LLRAYKLSPIVLCSALAFLVAGELACGTGLFFVTMMFVAMLSIGVTYNLLGGLSSFSGIIFAGFALRTIVVSQFAKVLLLEAADKNLELPQLTISVYAVFYLSALLGTFIYGRTRLRLPKPWEPETSAHSTILYSIALVAGLIGTIVYETYAGAVEGQEQIYNGTRSFALALSPLLLFSLIMAVDMRIARTKGRHSFGMGAFIPWLTLTAVGFVDSVRTNILVPSIVYAVTCYLRGYRFRMRHYVVLIAGAAVFTAILSPLALYSRNYARGMPLNERVYKTLYILTIFHDPRQLAASVETAFEESTGSREQYFSLPGTYLLSRFSLIRADSNVIEACAHGVHYGLGAVKIELINAVPSFLYKNKPRNVSGEDYIGHISGMSPDNDELGYPQISAVGDSYGAFGWPGVILFPFLCFPIVFVVFESMFDLSRPWGTVALGMTMFAFGEFMLDRFLPLVIRTPLYLILLSYFVGWIAKIVPVEGDHILFGGAASRSSAESEVASSPPGRLAGRTG